MSTLFSRRDALAMIAAATAAAGPNGR